jgi:hypothetical protein
MDQVAPQEIGVFGCDQKSPQLAEISDALT